jgi:multidrug efflux system membrane fusion protein
MQFTLRALCIGAVAAGCALALITGCKPKAGAGGAGKGGAFGAMTPSVTVSQPVQREVIDWDEYSGRLEAIETVDVRARVNGYLQSIHFKDGAEVKKGDLLFVIDPRPYQAELDRAQAELVQAQTRFELATSEAARAERLLKTKSISEEEADARNEAKRAAEASILSAKATVETARLNLEYTHITAPIDGRVGRKMMTEGNLVNGLQGQSAILTTIVSLDPIYCYFEPDENSVLKYRKLAREGTKSGLSVNIACELQLANETGFPHHGVLDFVDNRVDSGTGTLRLRGGFPNPGPDHVLQPGFFSRVRVPATAKYNGLLVPDLAISTDQAQKVLYVVNDQNTVEIRPIRLGPLLNGMRVIRQGIQPNDWVVVNGLMSVRPGAKVNPQKTTPTEHATNAVSSSGAN